MESWMGIARGRLWLAPKLVSLKEAEYTEG